MMSVEQFADRAIGWLPGARRIAALKDRLASFVDQGAQGAGNVVITAILARGLGGEHFASIGLMLGVYYFVYGFQRTNVVLPFIVSAAADQSAGRSLDDWWRINLIWIALITATLGLATAAGLLLAPNVGWVVHALEYATAVTPPMLLAEFGRRWLYQAHRPVTVGLSSVLYFVVGIGVALISFKVKSGWIGALAWIAAGFCVFAVARLALPPGPASWRSAVGRWLEHSRFAAWQSACHIPYAFYNASVVILIGLFGGPVAAAAYTATRTLTNPAISMVSAVDSLDKPRAALALVTDGIRGLNHSIRRTRRLLAVITGGYLAIIVLFPDLMLRLAFGHAYEGRGLEVRILAAAFFLMCMNQPSETLLIVLREGVLMFVIRMMTMIAAVAGFWWGSRLGGVLGCAWALLGVQAFNLIGLRIGEHLAERRGLAAYQADSR